MAQAEYAIDHIDPKKGVLVCGFDVNSNKRHEEWDVNHAKNNRFVPYRVVDWLAVHQEPGDWGIFLIDGEWKLTQFMGREWWAESDKIGHNHSPNRQAERGRKGGRKSKGRVNTEEHNRKISQSKIGKSRPEGLMSKVGKASAMSEANVNKVLYRCTETGKVTTAGPLTCYQKARGINPSNRVKLNQ
jgi:hypothetical protein